MSDSRMPWHHAAMRLFVKLFLRGLAAILPLALTGYVAYALVVGTEGLLRQILELFLPPDTYVAGMGVALAIPIVLLVGLLMYSFVVRKVYGGITALFERIPLVKSIYGFVVDVVKLVATGEERPFRRVVLVNVQGLELIGFVTRDDFGDLPEVGEGMVAVYLPMSYQLGGFTVMVPRAQTRDVAMSVEDALRFCVTAGVARRAAPVIAAAQ